MPAAASATTRSTGRLRPTRWPQPDDGVRERLQRAAAELDFDEIATIAAGLPAPLADWLRTQAVAFDAESILSGLVASERPSPDDPPR